MRSTAMGRPGQGNQDAGGGAEAGGETAATGHGQLRHRPQDEQQQGVEAGQVASEGGRAAERDRAQLEEQPDDLAQAVLLRVRVAVFGGRHVAMLADQFAGRWWLVPEQLVNRRCSSSQGRCPRFVNNAVTEKCGMAAQPHESCRP
jgi:hypothetical protein